MRTSTIVVVSLLWVTLGVGLALGQDATGPAKRLPNAASDGDVEQLKLHIAAKADLNKPDERGTPPICYAADGGHAEAVKLLIDNGAKANVAGANGRTALICGAQSGSVEVVDILLAAGADPKAKDETKSTALHMAAAMGRLEMVESLIKGGADVGAEDGRKETPLMLAMARGHTEVVDLLKQNGAKEPVVQRDPYGDMGGANSQQAQVMARTNVDVTIDPNVIREQLKAFDGLAAAIKVVADKGAAEEKAWIQRRIDNRATLIRAAEKQFGDELTYIKQEATTEKATKTIAAVDELIAKRKARNTVVGNALREERRNNMEQNADGMGMGRGRGAGMGMDRTNRGRGAGGGANARGGNNAMYGNGGAAATRPMRAEPNRPPVDGDTQAMSQAWVGAKADTKDGLIDSVHKLDLAELEGLRTIATEEQAKRTAAAIWGVMLARQERVDRVRAEWKVDDERQAKMAERLGLQPGQQPGQQPGMTGTRGQRGMRGTTGQDQQQTGTGRRYR